MGEKKSRQLIRKAKRQNQDAYVIVTGCYAQLDPDAIAAIDGVIYYWHKQSLKNC